MQQIQPLVTELREKYKAQPQKMQQAQMALYKEHGINPMASCLPMLVQLPIFIALFTVLRSAIELRFAGFLWVSDLSEPERLLAGLLPIPLNILPLIMTVTMVIQQKLTPTGGDPQQQKMMLIIMPIMMLFMLYNMASGLMLYWSVSQILSIVQLLHQRKLGSKKEARA
jgi:YidC/Oxa1 family membrane protein insertase